MIVDLWFYSPFNSIAVFKQAGAMVCAMDLFTVVKNSASRIRPLAWLASILDRNDLQKELYNNSTKLLDQYWFPNHLCFFLSLYFEYYVESIYMYTNLI